MMVLMPDSMMEAFWDLICRTARDRTDQDGSAATDEPEAEAPPATWEDEEGGSSPPSGEVAFVTDEASIPWEAEGWVNDYVNRNLDDLLCLGSRDRRVLNYSGIAFHIGEILHTVSFNNHIYIYDDNGVYRRDRGEVRRLLKLFLDELADVRLDDDRGDPPQNPRISTVEREVRGHLLATNLHTAYPFDQAEWMIPVRNGIVQIDRETGAVVLLDNSPELMFTYRLPVDYDPEADPSFILEVFKSWVGEENVVYLIQLPAVAFLQRWVGALKIAYLFEGPPDAGKTTYCELLQLFVGRGAYAQVGLQALTDGRFASAELEGKLVNICDDLEAIPMRSVGRFNDLTGSIYQRVERKGENGYETVLTAPHLFTCNRPPSIKKNIDNDAFWSRWVYLVWTNRFERDDTFKDRLFTDTNLSAFLNLVIEEIVAIARDRRRLKRMEPEEVKTLWLQSSDDVFRFVEQHFDRDPEAWITKDQVYDAYLQFCDREGIATRPKNSLSVALSRLGIAGARRTDPHTGKRIQVYTGITWRESSPPPIQGEEAGGETADDHQDTTAAAAAGPTGRVQDTASRDGDLTEKVWVEIRDPIRNEFRGADGVTYGPFPKVGIRVKLPRRDAEHFQKTGHVKIL